MLDKRFRKKKEKNKHETTSQPQNGLEKPGQNGMDIHKGLGKVHSCPIAYLVCLTISMHFPKKHQNTSRNIKQISKTSKNMSVPYNSVVLLFFFCAGNNVGSHPPAWSGAERPRSTWAHREDLISLI